MSSGFYCFHRWREVVSATWPCQELCDCMACTRALSQQALPLPRGTTPAEEGPRQQLVPSCKLGARSSMLPARLWQSGNDCYRCHCILGPKVLEGGNWGQSEYTVWEVYNSPEQERKEHGGNQSRYLPEHNMRTMQRQLGCRVWFLMPLNPKVAPDGRCSHWFVSYTKAQNRCGLAWIYGELNSEYLAAICEVVRRISKEIQDSRILVAG